MGFNLETFDDLQLDAEYLEWLVDVHSVDIQRHFSRLWDYYTNPTVDVSAASAVDRKVNASGRPYVQAQEYGLGPFQNGLKHGPAARAEW